LSQNANFFADFFGKNIFKNHNLGPIWSPWLCSGELPPFQCDRMLRGKNGQIFVKKSREEYCIFYIRNGFPTNSFGYNFLPKRRNFAQSGRAAPFSLS
jgi:hypothetical protein